MSVIVEQLSKVYGIQKAVDAISFEAEPGKILGFLGPNGAGKSTTMKIVTCFIPQTSGKVTVCGFDVIKDSLAVRNTIGYLPESNPLYTDMYVKEYLGFIAGMHKMGKETKSRIEEMIDKTGLVREQHKKIGQLSKGYRQRVGLAQAMLHNPKVLILDEPTTGLDPNQLVEIRALIKQLGKEKTVILSTHIMQEVEAVCDRIVIINKGVLVANEDTRTLQSKKEGTVGYKVEFDKTVTANQLKNINGVLQVTNLQGNTWLLNTNSQFDVRAEVFQFAVQNQLVMLSISKEEQSLESIFRQLTSN